MPSLDEAYGSRDGLSRPRRVLAGATLLALGALAVFAAIGFVLVGGDSTTAKLYAGIAAGSGIPAMLLGVVVVLPANPVQRAGVLAGTVLAGAGVYLFQYAYPSRWTRTADPLAFETLLVYGLGCALAVWFVFSAIASIRLRNNPPGHGLARGRPPGRDPDRPAQPRAVPRDRQRRGRSDGVYRRPRRGRGVAVGVRKRLYTAEANGGT
jgi:hypothetical protein